MHVDDRFRSHFEPFDLDELDRQSDTVYGLDADLRLVLLNAGWYVFARENGGEPAISRQWGLGRCVLDACTPELREFFDVAYRRALGRSEPWEHDYECSGPQEFRLLHQTVYPLAGAAGLLVVNARRIVRAHDPAERPPRPADEAGYRDADGYVHQCGHCRKTQFLDARQRWDWVPDWVAKSPPQTSHTLCPACLDYHFPR